jgi:predicted ATPase
VILANRVDLNSTRLYVLTGGPGSGKSTLLSALRTAGFQVVPESGRSIIQAEVAVSGRALPWADRAVFAERMFESDLASWHESQGRQGPVFFDRGMPDVIGYLRLCQLPVPVRIERAAHRFRYRPTVFIAPPWPEIFVHDAERKQSIEEAEATWQIMVNVYREFDYAVVHLPKVSVKERVRFVMERVQIEKD